MTSSDSIHVFQRNHHWSLILILYTLYDRTVYVLFYLYVSMCKNSMNCFIKPRYMIYCTLFIVVYITPK